MAVVQISRIQVRRGKEGTTGVPQLASGELGWAIDTRKLYIGSGSIAEGAQTVENVEILTENSNIIDQIGNYIYKKDGGIQTGATPSVPVERTIQEKLDDIVSVRDFGAAGDGTDQTLAIQRAVDQLYLGASKGLASGRPKLYMPEGEYLISTPIYIPPYATVIGAGKDKTIINATGAHAFFTVNETSTPGNYEFNDTTTSSNQPRNITIKSMTIQHESYGYWDNGNPRKDQIKCAIYLDCVRDSVFEDIKFVGPYTLGDTILFPHTTGIAMISINSPTASEHVGTQNNIFKDLEFEKVAFPVLSDYDITHNKFIGGRMNETGYGFVFGVRSTGGPGEAFGSRYSIIENYKFMDVYYQAILVELGKYNKSINNTFIAVGNAGGNSSTAEYSIIKYAERFNTSEGDYFERTADLTIDNPTHIFFNNEYTSEIEGYKDYYYSYPISVAVGNSDDFEDFIRFPTDTSKGIIEVNYTYNVFFDSGSSSSDITRKGLLTIVYDLSIDQITLNDQYTAIGDPTRVDLLEFQLNAVDQWNAIRVHKRNTTLDETGSPTDEFIFNIRHKT